MAILKIADDNHHLIQRLQTAVDPVVCLLDDDIQCEASWFRDAPQCAAVALVTRRSRYLRRGKPLVEYELSQQYGCPVRIFTQEKAATQWLERHLNKQQQ